VTAHVTPPPPFQELDERARVNTRDRAEEGHRSRRGVSFRRSRETRGVGANLMLFLSRTFDTLLDSVAQRISARFPPVVANDPERKVSHERIKEIAEETFAAALQSEPERQIGFVGRVRLRSALGRKLREIGYDEKFVNFAVETFMVQLARGPR
jgi:hypothetical protein